MSRTAQRTRHTLANGSPVVMPGGAASAPMFRVVDQMRPLVPVGHDSFLDDVPVYVESRNEIRADTLASIETHEAEGFTLDTLEECPRESQPHLAYTHVRMTTEGRAVEWHSHAYPAREVVA